MDEKQYSELLDKAYSELPQVLHKTDRFEIPKVSGRIIRSRTLITNFRELAKTFSRNEGHFTRFFLKEVGVRGELNPRGELELAAKFQPGILNRTVERYYQNFVECEYCKSPDTTLEGSIIKCKACGHETKAQNL